MILRRFSIWKCITQPMSSLFWFREKLVLLTASRENDAFKIDVIPMEPNKVYNVLQGTWFNTITQKDTKLIYVQDAGTTTENSEYCDMTEVELSMVREKAKIALQ